MSNVIKSHFANKEDENKRVISIKDFSFLNPLDLEDEIIEDEEEEEKIDLEQIHLEASQIISKAHQEAEAIKKSAQSKYEDTINSINEEKNNWEVEKQQWIQNAQNEGYTAGHNLGKQEGLDEYKGLIEEAKSVINLSKQDYEKHIEMSEPVILHLGMKVAEKIIGTKLADNPEVFTDLVKKVIKEVKDQQEIQVHVNPANYGLLLSHKEELLSLFIHPTTELYIFPDDQLPPGSCIIESEFGRIDASIDSQLNEIKTKLNDILEESFSDESS